jgi:hypothetical protein
MTISVDIVPFTYGFAQRRHDVLVDVTEGVC